MNMSLQTSSNYEPWNYTGAANFYDVTSNGQSFLNQVLLTTEVPSTNIEYDDKGRYSVYDVADWFLCKSDMTHKKLQKLCYYAQAWCYALKGYRLIDTDFEAWVHGPVSPALWERFKIFGYSTITLKGRKILDFAPEDKELLENVWDTYGDHTGNALEALTHRELPWIEARKGYSPDENCDRVISPKIMTDYYRSIYSGD